MAQAVAGGMRLHASALAPPGSRRPCAAAAQPAVAAVRGGEASTSGCGPSSRRARLEAGNCNCDSRRMSASPRAPDLDSAWSCSAFAGSPVLGRDRRRHQTGRTTGRSGPTAGLQTSPVSDPPPHRASPPAPRDSGWPFPGRRDHRDGPGIWPPGMVGPLGRFRLM